MPIANWAAIPTDS